MELFCRQRVLSKSRNVLIFACSVSLVLLIFLSKILWRTGPMKTRATGPMLKFQNRDVLIEKDIESLPLCPEAPPNLRSNVQPDERWKALEDDPSILQHVKPGGTYKPRDCRARERVAIIVPYRDREEHLQKFLAHIHQFLQKQQLHYTIFIAEMTHGTIFNTGLMQNVGFEAADKTGNFTCFIIHDVDLMPTNENNLYRCDDKVAVHIATNNSKYNYRKLYDGYFGGVVAVRRHMYLKANGFSNLYFGWGSQDDDFRARLVRYGFKPREVPRHIGVYEALPHERDAGNPDGVGRGRFARNPTKRMDEEGLNSLQYKLLKHELKDLYTWVLAEVNQTQVMEKYKDWQ